MERKDDALVGDGGELVAEAELVRTGALLRYPAEPVGRDLSLAVDHLVDAFGLHFHVNIVVAARHHAEEDFVGQRSVQRGEILEEAHLVLVRQLELQQLRKAQVLAVGGARGGAKQQEQQREGRQHGAVWRRKWRRACGVAAPWVHVTACMRARRPADLQAGAAEGLVRRRAFVGHAVR